MEIISVAGSTDTGSTFTQAVGKEQNMDAFSELLALLFGNMLIPGMNQYSLAVNQSSPVDSSDTSENSIELNQALSVINNLRISGNQLKSVEDIQSLINSNSLLKSVLGNNTTDLQNLFSLSDSISGELQEFINNINGIDTADSSSKNILDNGINPKSSNTIDNIFEQLNINAQASKGTAINYQINIEAEGNQTVLELPVQSNTLLNTAELESEKETDLLNITSAIESETPSTESVTILSDTQGTGYEGKKNEAGIDNSADSQFDIKSILSERKTGTSFELPNNPEQVIRLDSIRNENIKEMDLQPNDTESALIEKPQDLIDITVTKFKTLRLPGSTEVTVKLKPEELGEVSLKLVLEKGQINGSITADRKEVVSMLQNNLEQLKTDLKNSNVNLNNLSVNVQSEENFDRNNNRHGFNSKQNKSSHRMVQAFEEEIQSSNVLEGLNIIA